GIVSCGLVDDQAHRRALARSSAMRARQPTKGSVCADALKSLGGLHQPGCDHLIQKIHVATPSVR
ncbi:MAG: hypothetical protein E7A86_31210, partial [Bradyrhizobium sp.]|nr:hypothetical protein [Bradyrhizobium sp.]